MQNYLEDFLMNYSEMSKVWLNSDKVSEADKKIILDADDNQLKDMFYQDLAFGTAGLRGVMGPGTNRMNKFVITKATIGVGLYYQKYRKLGYKGIAISYDNRNNSKEFAFIAQSILNEMGIDTYIFDKPHPTPELSFAVRYYKCFAGIMITASHNPKEYNGYKVYDEEGCQLVFEKIDNLIAIIDKLPSYLDCEVPVSDTKGKSMICDDDLDPVFIDKEISTSIGCKIFKNDYRQTQIVFSPQCGANSIVGPKILRGCHYDVTTTPGQDYFDPNFTGTKSPNPENKEAYTKSIETLLELNKKGNPDPNKKYTLIMTSDPDADRVGVAFLNSKNEVELYTGNQIGAMLIDFLFHYYQENGLIPPNGMLYESFVTSTLGKKVATSYNVNVETVLTGFKYIGNKIATEKDKIYLFGYEESYGYLIYPFVRDKDSLQSMILIADMVEYYARRGKTLDIVYDELQQKFGYYSTETYSIQADNADHFAKMKDYIEHLIDTPADSIGNYKVTSIIDYNRQLNFNKATNSTTTFDDLPKSNCIKFILGNSGWIAIRPSGTEPKVKVYIEIISKKKGSNTFECDKLFNVIKNKLKF